MRGTGGLEGRRGCQRVNGRAGGQGCTVEVGKRVEVARVPVLRLGLSMALVVGTTPCTWVPVHLV